jgi:hypothetical protein
LIYVSMLMYSSGRKQTTNDILMLGIFVGLCAGFVTDLIVTLGGHDICIRQEKKHSIKECSIY